MDDPDEAEPRKVWKEIDILVRQIHKFQVRSRYEMEVMKAESARWRSRALALEVRVSGRADSGLPLLIPPLLFVLDARKSIELIPRPCVSEQPNSSLSEVWIHGLYYTGC